MGRCGMELIVAVMAGIWSLFIALSFCPLRRER